MLVEAPLEHLDHVRVVGPVIVDDHDPRARVGFLVEHAEQLGRGAVILRRDEYLDGLVMPQPVRNVVRRLLPQADFGNTEVDSIGRACLRLERLDHRGRSSRCVTESWPASRLAAQHVAALFRALPSASELRPRCLGKEEGGELARVDFVELIRAQRNSGPEIRNTTFRTTFVRRDCLRGIRACGRKTPRPRASSRGAFPCG